jgi:16S rRNA processing protein RimM
MSAPDPTAPAATVEVVVGRIGKAHGLRGDVVVDVRTDEPVRRFATGTRFDTRRGDLVVTSTHWHGSRLLVHFAGVGDRDEAETLRGLELTADVPVDERPDDPEEFYDHQLVGLEAFDPEGQPAGRVVEVVHLPAQDLLVVRRLDGGDAMVPFVRELVPDVDLGAGRLLLSPTTRWLTEAGAGTQKHTAVDEPGWR